MLPRSSADGAHGVRARGHERPTPPNAFRTARPIARSRLCPSLIKHRHSCQLTLFTRGHATGRDAHARAATPCHTSASVVMPGKKKRSFNAKSFLEAAGPGKRVVSYERGDIIFSQGDLCDSVMYVRNGGIQLMVVSHAGKEAVVATLSRGDFLGEGALDGHPVRLVTARATMPTTVMIVPKRQMIRLLHTQRTFSDRFIAHMLLRNARLEADLVDHLFNSSEKRLARALLLLARFGQSDKPRRVLPSVSQETLAEMVGTTRPRVNFFLNKFRKLGFIGYDAAGLTVNPALLSVVVHD